MEMAKVNSLAVEKYLVYLMDKISYIDIHSKDALLELMPWFTKLPKELKVSKRK